MKISYFVYVLNNHCHWVTTQLRLINIIIIKMTKEGGGGEATYLWTASAHN
jgi:hypothetical protein